MTGNNNKWSLIIEIIFIIILTYFSFSLIFKDNYRIFIFDDFNLLIHEAGHIVFGIFGHIIGLLGGTITQLMVPMLFLIYFLIQSDHFGTGFSVFWIGDNLINISNYIFDAKDRILPLVGGGLHDWFEILSSLNLLNSYKLIGTTVFIVGMIMLVISLYLNIYNVVSTYISNKN